MIRTEDGGQQTALEDGVRGACFVSVSVVRARDPCPWSVFRA